MEFNWSQTPAHTLSIRVEEKHIDVLGHANNCEYPKWMEDVAWSHCHQVGLPFEKWQQLGYAWVARRTEIDYLVSAMKDDEIIAATWIEENDQKLSMTRAYELKRASDGVTLIKGKTKWVCINLSTGRPARMPPEFQQAFPVANS
ncbi:acyl-CoA thioesterase [Bacterioplanoides sp.]|uniref:acyl-CoA thioesterase n=1 Tax=Bacterioplanoides sp. TaxID=2066072 RepID=UPI003B5A43B6